MRVLVTGITGFAGSHLAEFLFTQPGVEVFGIQRWRSKTENIEHVRDRIRMTECDMRDASSVFQAIEQIRPDRIFHLAAQSFVPTSWQAPAETLMTNITGQLNIFEAVRKLKLPVRIHVAGSSEEYGLVHPHELPITETNPLRPLSPYGVSKVAQDLLGYQYFKSYNMDIIRTRAFNHTGARRGEVFATSDFSKQIARIEAGLQEPVIRVGNLDAKRDFSDVRDVVRGYWLSLEHGESGEVYNICSGRSVSIREMLDMLLAMSDRRIEIVQDPQRLRPSDVMLLQGDASKFRKRTGWEPRFTLKQTLEDLLNYWRTRMEWDASKRAEAEPA